MKNFKLAVPWIALVGGAVLLFVGMLDARKDVPAIVGAILIGSAVIAFAVNRD